MLNPTVSDIWQLIRPGKLLPLFSYACSLSGATERSPRNLTKSCNFTSRTPLHGNETKLVEAEGKFSAASSNVLAVEHEGNFNFSKNEAQKSKFV
jgi:hypothetical protein